jgi:hypothetical protein
MVMLFVENVGRIGCLWAICRECGPICRECGSEVPPICTECEPNQGDICGPEGLRLWATTSTVPYVCRLRRAKSSTPSTVGVGRDGTGSLRSRRSRVLRLTTRSHWWLRRTPAVPPRATPRATKRWASRSVRRAHGAATVGKRSVKMRRRQERLRQNHLRTCRWRRTR